MSSWEKGETRTDKHGVIIHPGDIVICLDYLGDAWEKNGCQEHRYGIDIRDFNAHNIGYCETGLDGNCITVGHYSNYAYFMTNEDPSYEWFDQMQRIEEHFNVDRRSDEFFNLINSLEGRNKVNALLFKNPPVYTEWTLPWKRF